jgi:sigma-B regulation protein RsbU (phosphoserine phosphatase)
MRRFEHLLMEYFVGMELTAETKYQLLAQISHEIRDTLDLDEILSHLLDMVGSIVQYDAAGIFVLNEDLVYSGNHQPRELIAGICLRGFDPRPNGIDPMLREGKGIIGHVIKTGQCVVAQDIRIDPHYLEGRKQTLSEIAVPIVRNGRAIGTLNLESDELNAFDRDDVEVLRFFADAASISIEKAMLHRQILEKERIEEQLELASNVQARLLPDRSPVIPGYDIAGTCLSTYDIGGDYFDYIDLPGGRLGIVVADVSGHGIPAALIMAAFRALLRTQTRIDAEPSHIADAMKRLLPDFTGEANFVTCVYGVLDPANGVFTYVNCGHIPPVLLHADGRIEELKPGGPIFSGVIEHDSYSECETRIAPGDTLVLYTDGVVEIMNERQEEFGADRMMEIMKRSCCMPVEDIISEVICETQEFAGTESNEDDFTLVIVRRK